MTDNEFRDLRAMVLGSQIRISNMALLLHKEQERVQDIISLIDVALTNKGGINGNLQLDSN